MRKKYKIKWSNVAGNDLTNIIKYIAINTPANALKISEKIKKKTSTLYEFPERGRIVPELQDHGFCNIVN